MANIAEYDHIYFWEKKMSRFRSLISIAAFSLAVLCLPAIASAQYNGGYGNGGYGNNGGYNNGGYNNGGYNNGRYGNGGYNNGRYGNDGYGDTRSIVRDLKKKAGDFQRQLDRDLDHSRMNGTRREDQVNQLARDFHNAVNRLDSNGNNSNNDYRLQEIFNLASQIDRNVGRAGSYNSQNIWQGVRYDLQQLGQSSGGYNNNGGGYNNGRTNRRTNGTWTNGNRPSWWPF